MGDQHNGHVPAALLAREQIQDLCLDRRIERGRRLVGDQQLGLVQAPAFAAEFSAALDGPLAAARAARRFMTSQ